MLLEKNCETGLENEGIDTTHVLIHPEAATGVALIQVDTQGHNSIAVASGANFRLTGSDVEKAMQTIGRFDALVMPLETQLETVYTGGKNCLWSRCNRYFQSCTSPGFGQESSLN